MNKKKSQDLKVSTRGQEFLGKVISAKMSKTATVSWERRKYVRKYERYEKRRTSIHAHNPESIAAVEGDIVRVKQTRPLSKTKHYIIIEKIQKEDQKKPAKEKSK